MPVLTEKKRDGKSVWVWNYSEDWEQTEKRAIVEAYNARMRGLLSASQ